MKRKKPKATMLYRRRFKIYAQQEYWGEKGSIIVGIDHTTEISRNRLHVQPIRA